MAQEDLAYVGNAGRGSQGLAQALGTTTPVVKPRLPTGPKPIPAAPVPEPAAAAPIVSEPQDTAEPDIGKIAALRGSKDEQAVLGGLSRATEEQYKASSAAATLAQKAENDKTERAAKAAKDIADKAKVISSQEEAATGKFKEFVPTQSNAKDIGALFSLLTVAAFGAGGQGRYAGMMAMKNMSGALQGYKEGRTDLFNKELKEYDKNFAAMKANNDLAQKTYNRAMELLSLDKEAGLAEMAHLASLDSNGVVAMQVRAHDWEGVGKSLETRAKAIRLSEEKREKLAQDAKIKADALQETQARNQELRRHNSEMENLSRNRLDAGATRRDEKALQAIGPALRTIAEQYPDGTAEKLVGASTEDKKRITYAYRALENSEETADFIARNPGAVGAMAVVKNYLKIDAINSIKNQDEVAAATEKSQLVDAAIDKAVANKKISIKDAQDAKILQKKLFNLALTDVQGSGQRGSIYLDKQFQNLYDQASRGDTLLKIVKERAKENNGNLKIYKLNVERHDNPEQFPLLESESVEKYMKDRAPVTTKTPTTEHIKMLKESPDALTRKHFDEAYGEGAAKKVLGN